MDQITKLFKKIIKGSKKWGSSHYIKKILPIIDKIDPEYFPDVIKNIPPNIIFEDIPIIERIFLDNDFLRSCVETNGKFFRPMGRYIQVLSLYVHDDDKLAEGDSEIYPATIYHLLMEYGSSFEIIKEIMSKITGSVIDISTLEDISVYHNGAKNYLRRNDCIYYTGFNHVDINLGSDLPKLLFKNIFYSLINNKHLTIEEKINLFCLLADDKTNINFANSLEEYHRQIFDIDLLSKMIEYVLKNDFDSYLDYFHREPSKEINPESLSLIKNKIRIVASVLKHTGLEPYSYALKCYLNDIFAMPIEYNDKILPFQINQIEDDLIYLFDLIDPIDPIENLNEFLKYTCRYSLPKVALYLLANGVTISLSKKEFYYALLYCPIELVELMYEECNDRNNCLSITLDFVNKTKNNPDERVYEWVLNKYLMDKDPMYILHNEYKCKYSALMSKKFDL